MTDLNILLEPYELKHFTLKNRLISTAHSPGYTEDGMPKERYQLYHEEKAKGGTSMTMFGGSSTISPDCPASFGQIDVSQDKVIPYLKQFSSRIHNHGCKTMCQIAHMGRRSTWQNGYWLHNVSPSAIREPEHRSFPKEMEEWDIERIIGDFGRAARRCREGGLDGVELAFSSMQLIGLFMSPISNTRTDKWGGSLENRMRFGMLVIDEVRRCVGDDFHVGLRMAGDELLEKGLPLEECVEMGKMLAKTDKIDHLSVSGGAPLDFRNLTILMAGMSFPVAPVLYIASAFKAEIDDVCIIHAQRLSDVYTAARALNEGHVDLVGLTRAQLADPHLVNKLIAGRVDDIRQCVGANYCIDRIYAGGEALCIQNPASSREDSLPHIITRADTVKKVVIIGAGPAGLEAARVSASRGHKVILFEKQDAVGGQINLAKRATWREALSGIPRWLHSQVMKMEVDLRLGITATNDNVLAENPDVVVIATGGTPNKGFDKGAELADSTWDILSDKVKVKNNVLLFDDHGGHQGLSCAEVLLKNCMQLEITTPDRYLGVEMGGTNFPIHFREIYKKGAVISPNLRLIEVFKEDVDLVAVLRNEYTLEEEERVVDQVVCEHGTLPNDELYFSLKPLSKNRGAFNLDKLAYENVFEAVETNQEGKFILLRIGDAVASRNIHAAIYDGLRYCKDL